MIDQFLTILGTYILTLLLDVIKAVFSKQFGKREKLQGPHIFGGLIGALIGVLVLRVKEVPIAAAPIVFCALVCGVFVERKYREFGIAGGALAGVLIFTAIPYWPDLRWPDLADLLGAQQVMLEELAARAPEHQHMVARQAADLAELKELLVEQESWLAPRRWLAASFVPLGCLVGGYLRDKYAKEAEAVTEAKAKAKDSAATQS